MAKVKPEDVVYHLSSEFTKALKGTMAQFAPDAEYDERELLKFFMKRVYRHCAQWESVPDSIVKI